MKERECNNVQNYNVLKASNRMKLGHKFLIEESYQWGILDGITVVGKYDLARKYSN